MKQHYDKYTEEDFEVWKILFDRQIDNLQDKASTAYLNCLYRLEDVLHGERIPVFDSLNSKLRSVSGWTIEVVPGLIPVEQFFAFLAEKKFCSSTWLRTKSQLDYLEEPDMFHDIFGHIPLLLESKYAEFMQRIGQLGVANKESPQIVLALQRLYWFTIEFGLVKEAGKDRIYGAGILSSFGETNHVLRDSVAVLPFDLAQVFQQSFINSEIQTLYYELDTLNDLYDQYGLVESEVLRVK